jgi:hypothetical protein
LISNGITIPQGKPLTPEMIGVSEVKTSNAAPKFNKQSIIVAGISIVSLAILFAVARKAKNQNAN